MIILSERDSGVKNKTSDEEWYELTDFVRDALREKGHTVDYTADDVIIDGYSMKRIVKG